MANYNFSKDINDGEKGELIVRFDLESEGAKFLSENKDYRYDLKMGMPNGKEILLEIKTDVYCKPNRDTGNMFIEYECRGKASGINITLGDYFVYYYPYLKEIWYIKTSKLRKLIQENNFRETQFSGDEGSNTKGFLINRNSQRQHFKVRQIDYEWEN